MLYLLMIAAVFFADFFIKRFVDKKYARRVTHPKCKNKIIIEKIRILLFMRKTQFFQQNQPLQPTVATMS